MPLILETPAFAPNQNIPRQFSSDGGNISPLVEWHGAPAGTQSFALVVEDPDGTRRVVPDPAERQTLTRILRLRRQGQTWESIATELNAAGVRTRGGKPLLKQHVCSMHKAALALEEAGGLIGENDPLPPNQPPQPAPEPTSSHSSALATWFVTSMRELLPRL